MAFYSLQLEYALDGNSNYIALKDRMEAMLQDNGLKEFIDQDITKPTTSNAQNLAKWKKCVARVSWTILERVQDHIVSSLHGKETPHAMWKSLKDLFQNNGDQRKLALKDKIQKIKMEAGDSFPNYFIKFTQCLDELGSVGITVAEDDMVSLSLLRHQRVGIVITTLSMVRRSCQIGNDYGQT